jgi:Phage integrase family
MLRRSRSRRAGVHHAGRSAAALQQLPVAGLVSGAEAAKLPRVGVHALRHTSASLLIDAGSHPKSIQRHLGHSSITTTLNIYGHLMPDEQDQVADARDDLRAGGSRPSAAQMPTRNRRMKRVQAADLPDEGRALRDSNPRPSDP